VDVDADSDTDGDSDADADSDADTDTDTDTGEAGCPAPRVWCDGPPPDCGPDEFPEVDPAGCPNGWCAGRCYTGACAPCATECDADSDCALVTRHGCCCGIGDDVWARPQGGFAECEYEAGTRPAPPDGCPKTCEESEACLTCYHCSPDSARCEGGRCVEAWTLCEPECGCD